MRLQILLLSTDSQTSPGSCQRAFVKAAKSQHHLQDSQLGPRPAFHHALTPRDRGQAEHLHPSGTDGALSAPGYAPCFLSDALAPLSGQQGSRRASPCSPNYSLTEELRIIGVFSTDVHEPGSAAPSTPTKMKSDPKPALTSVAAETGALVFPSPCHAPCPCPGLGLCPGPCAACLFHLSSLAPSRVPTLLSSAGAPCHARAPVPVLSPSGAAPAPVPSPFLVPSRVVGFLVPFPVLALFPLKREKEKSLQHCGNIQKRKVSKSQT